MNADIFMLIYKNNVPEHFGSLRGLTFFSTDLLGHVKSRQSLPITLSH